MRESLKLVTAVAGGLAAAGVVVAVGLPWLPARLHTAWLTWVVTGVIVAIAIAVVFRADEPGP